MNHLYYGDCLTIMQGMALQSVDLIYLDPPFNSNRDYNAIYKDETGRPLPDQIEAFTDTWTLDQERERAIQQMPILIRDAGLDDEVAEFWKLWTTALRRTNPRLLAYLSYMVQRLLPMRGLLSPCGSIYLHCDPTASHYIKVMMDAIFGHDNFRNEIIWSYRRWPAKSRNFQTMHDIILRYSKGTDITWNQLYEPLAPSTLKADGGKKILNVFDETGRRVRGKKTGENSPGAPMRDVWDIGVLSPTAKERMGYATQKPLTLLKRIIEASSNPGDTVFDPFCGCATTLEAAHVLGRRWIGIDIAIHAVKRVAKVRLEQRLRLVEGEDFTVEGVPRNLEGARDLWQRDKYQFQKWAVEQVDGFVTTRRTGDGGIDGRLYFAMPQQDAKRRDPLRSMVLEVKGGRNVGVGAVRDLRGVLEREEAEMAGLILLEEPGAQKRKNFDREMAAAGDLNVLGVRYPRMQVLTADEILNGKRFLTPSPVGRAIGQGTLDLTGNP